MLKKRIIGAIIVRDGIAVQSFGFRRWLPIGKPSIVARYLDSWGVDEICVLDISATPAGRSLDLAMLESIAAEVFVPVSAGGGLRSMDQVRAVISGGADKAVINTFAHESPAFLGTVAETYGCQAAVAAMDVLWVEGRPMACVRPNGGGLPEPRIDAREHAKVLEANGAGELLVNAIAADGAGTGLDLDLLDAIAPLVSIPVIGMGGTGQPRDLVAAFARVPAVAVGNVFTHCEHAAALFREAALAEGLVLRQHGRFSYDTVPIDPTGRLKKRDEGFLDDLGFINVEKEIL